MLNVTRQKAKVGDIVAIPVTENYFSCAHILIKKKILYVVIFEEMYNFRPEVGTKIFDHPIMTAWTADAKIYFGDWEILGNIKPLSIEMFKNNYKVNYNMAVWVENFEGDLLRVANENEISKLHNRSSYSPARLERAIRAFHRLEPWSSDFDDLLLVDR